MAELSVKLKIADREYPMRVAQSDEEGVRRAAQTINERVKSYHERFPGLDNQDLLSMVAFDLLMEASRQEKARQEDSRLVESRLSDWTSKLEKY